MNSAFILFVVCTFANVILGTIKTVATVNGSKFSAAFWNAMSFGLYSYIVIMTANADLTTAEKIFITIGCNLVGVYLVKLFEQRLRKDKVWKFEVTVNSEFTDEVHELCNLYNLSHNYIDNVGKHTIFNIYAQNQAQSEVVNDIVKRFNAKSFATETKLM